MVKGFMQRKSSVCSRGLETVFWFLLRWGRGGGSLFKGAPRRPIISVNGTPPASRLLKNPSGCACVSSNTAALSVPPMAASVSTVRRRQRESGVPGGRRRRARPHDSAHTKSSASGNDRLDRHLDD